MLFIYDTSKVLNKTQSCVCTTQVFLQCRMLILSDYVLLACISTIYEYGHVWLIKMHIKFQFLGSGALFLRFETCLERIIRHVSSYLRHKHKLLILSCLRHFMTCSTHFNIHSEGSISQLWNTVG